MHKGKFEELIIWQEGILLAKEVFMMFEKCPVYSIKNQIERAAISISANIAEGFELGSAKQFVKHLYIAKGSCGEVKSLLYFCREMMIYPDEKLSLVIDQSRKLSIMIYNLIVTKR